MKAGDDVEVRVTHADGTARWIDARVCVEERRGIVWVETSAATFAVAAANVRPAGVAG